MGSSWCNTVSKLVMKLDAIKLGRALATYISDATPCSSSVRSRQGTTVFVSEGTDGHVPPRGPPDQTSPSNPRKLSPALLSRHDAPAGITETTLASLASSGLIRMRSSPAKWSSDWLEKQNVESHTATDGEQVREQRDKSVRNFGNLLCTSDRPGSSGIRGTAVYRFFLQPQQALPVVFLLFLPAPAGLCNQI